MSTRACSNRSASRFFQAVASAFPDVAQLLQLRPQRARRHLDVEFIRQPRQQSPRGHRFRLHPGTQGSAMHRLQRGRRATARAVGQARKPQLQPLPPPFAHRFERQPLRRCHVLTAATCCQRQNGRRPVTCPRSWRRWIEWRPTAMGTRADAHAPGEPPAPGLPVNSSSMSS